MPTAIPSSGDAVEPDDDVPPVSPASQPGRRSL